MFIKSSNCLSSSIWLYKCTSQLVKSSRYNFPKYKKYKFAPMINKSEFILQPSPFLFSGDIYQAFPTISRFCSNSWHEKYPCKNESKFVFSSFVYLIKIIQEFIFPWIKLLFNNPLKASFNWLKIFLIKFGGSPLSLSSSRLFKNTKRFVS